MVVPERLTPVEQLYLVVGEVAVRFAMIKDATLSLSRALDGDFTLAVGQQRGPAISRAIEHCKKRFKSDERLSTLADVAVDALIGVGSSVTERNDLVHKLWVVEDREDGPEYRLLTEDDSNHSDSKTQKPPKTQSASELGELAQVLEKQQKQLNALKNSVAFHFGSWIHNGAALDELHVRQSRALVAGEFDFVDGLPLFRDDSLAKESNSSPYSQEVDRYFAPDGMSG